MIKCDEPGCTMLASHVLVDYYHTPIDDNDSRSMNGIYFCRNHAFREERGCCHICEDYPDITTKIDDPNTGESMNLKRTYAPGELDVDDMCSDHP